jgi:hypothetical protein
MCQKMPIHSKVLLAFFVLLLPIFLSSGKRALAVSGNIAHRHECAWAAILEFSEHWKWRNEDTVICSHRSYYSRLFVIVFNVKFFQQNNNMQTVNSPGLAEILRQQT